MQIHNHVQSPHLIAKESALEIQLCTSSHDFLSLKEEWNPLLNQSSSPNIFLTWEWISTWWECFGEGLKPWILIVRERPGGQLVGVAPFVLRTFPFTDGPWRELSLMGGSFASGDHLDALVRLGYQHSAAARFADFLRAHCRDWDVVRLDRMDSKSPLLTHLRQDAKTAMMWETVCPFVPLPRGFDELMATLDKKVRHNLQRHAQRLCRETGGAVEFQRVDSPADIPDALAHLSRLHQDIRSRHGDDGIFHDPMLRRFYRQITERLASQGWLRMYLLKVHGQVIAVAYCFVYQKRVYYYQTGYDQLWARYGPGMAVTMHAIRASIDEGACEFDFLRGAEHYKSQWTQLARRNLRLWVGTSAVGRLQVNAVRMLHAGRCRFRNWRGTESDSSRFAVSGG